MTADLRKLAEAATPGPWRFDGEVVTSDRGVVTRSPRITEQCAPGGINDAAFIAACSPEVVHALLDRAEKAERERDDERLLATMRGEFLTKCERERDKARAAIELLTLSDDDLDALRDGIYGDDRMSGATLDAALAVFSRLYDAAEALRAHGQKAGK